MTDAAGVIFAEAILASCANHATILICHALRDYPTGHEDEHQLRYYIEQGRSVTDPTRKENLLLFGSLYCVPVVVALFPGLWSTYAGLTFCCIPLALLGAWSDARRNAKECRKGILRLLEEKRLARYRYSEER